MLSIDRKNTNQRSNLILSEELRLKFKEFFGSNIVLSPKYCVESKKDITIEEYPISVQHQYCKSSSLIPSAKDPSLMFINSGMVPFKGYLLGTEEPPFPNAFSIQRCVRAGGKHNDLDQIGYTGRHHTLFEMLGNFSFGLYKGNCNYSRREAIYIILKFLVDDLQIPFWQLCFTVDEKDEESYKIWKGIILSYTISCVDYLIYKKSNCEGDNVLNQEDIKVINKYVFGTRVGDKSCNCKRKKQTQEESKCKSKLTRSIFDTPDIKQLSIVETDQSFGCSYKGYQIGSEGLERIDRDGKSIKNYQLFKIKTGTDNWWSVGETGLCGYCTEIYHRKHNNGVLKNITYEGVQKEDEEDIVEIWNIVCMEYNRLSGQKLEKLPKMSIDTGGGFERLLAVLNNKTNNFDTQLFTPIIEKAKSLWPVKSDELKRSGNSIFYYQIIADHIRSICFLISDNVTPSIVGSGYVLRKIIRRACNSIIKLSGDLYINTESLTRLVETVIKNTNITENWDKILIKNRSRIDSIIKEEEAKYYKVLNASDNIVKKESILLGKCISQLSGTLIQDNNLDKAVQFFNSTVSILQVGLDNSSFKKSINPIYDYSDIYDLLFFLLKDETKGLKEIKRIQNEDHLNICKNAILEFRKCIDTLQEFEKKSDKIKFPEEKYIINSINNIAENQERKYFTRVCQNWFFARIKDTYGINPDNVINCNSFTESNWLKYFITQNVNILNFEEEIENWIFYYLQPILRGKEKQSNFIPSSLLKGIEDTNMLCYHDNKFSSKANLLAITVMHKGGQAIVYHIDQLKKLNIDKIFKDISQKWNISNLTEEIISQINIFAIFDKTPFYAEGGGQMGDVGSMELPSHEDRVERCNNYESQDSIIHSYKSYMLDGDSFDNNIDESCYKLDNVHYINTDKGKIVAHKIDFTEKSLTEKGSTDINILLHQLLNVLLTQTEYILKIDIGLRYGSTIHHSATHLLNSALRMQLGDEIIQKGSQVYPDSLRFDFLYCQEILEQEILKLETKINEMILTNAEVVIYNNVEKNIAFEQMKAISLENENYNQSVRVVNFVSAKNNNQNEQSKEYADAISVELCGGMHVRRLGDIGIFKIISCKSIAAGIKRIEAVAGLSAYRYNAQLQSSMQVIAKETNVNNVSKFLESNRDGERYSDRLESIQEIVQKQKNPEYNYILNYIQKIKDNNADLQEKLSQQLLSIFVDKTREGNRRLLGSKEDGSINIVNINLNEQDPDIIKKIGNELCYSMPDEVHAVIALIVSRLKDQEKKESRTYIGIFKNRKIEKLSNCIASYQNRYKEAMIESCKVFNVKKDIIESRLKAPFFFIDIED